MQPLAAVFSGSCISLQNIAFRQDKVTNQLSSELARCQAAASDVT